ncbi:TetR/AcrR family transcriptional regulator [Acetobacterium bakii]|uniref:HTH tetR-type domain-containing protein n=1 Tax=Acetobacterium bakii TaxID=52689 RepID=A0A0L6TYC9_9FIRM|nr:TetR/AcrR family transcriptional regulator [Acetobacterium bakii]KNZ41266.1 hypothetical protein AKG39_13225 [Acetobacterium bakii]
MGRRKKELTEFHRDSIIQVAETLFEKNGIEKTTMNDIAREADYSKATLYVYFKNKEEIVNCIILNSMKMLYDRIQIAIHNDNDLYGKYYGICNELTVYCDDYPLYFETVLQEINVDFEDQNTPPVFKDIFDIGEQINEELGAFFQDGMDRGIFRPDLQIPQVVFIFWSSLSGIIHMAFKKQKYIEQAMGVTKQAFLKYSFDTLLRSILTEEKKNA